MKHVKDVVLTICAPLALAASRRTRTLASGSKRRHGWWTSMLVMVLLTMLPTIIPKASAQNTNEMWIGDCYWYTDGVEWELQGCVTEGPRGYLFFHIPTQTPYFWNGSTWVEWTNRPDVKFRWARMQGGSSGTDVAASPATHECNTPLWQWDPGNRRYFARGCTQTGTDGKYYMHDYITRGWWIYTASGWMDYTQWVHATLVDIHKGLATRIQAVNVNANPAARDMAHFLARKQHEMAMEWNGWVYTTLP